MAFKPFLQRVFFALIDFPENLLKFEHRALLNPEARGILRFVRNFTPKASSGGIALDVGAGSRRWKNLVEGLGYVYHSSDLENPFTDDGSQHDFIGSAESLPVPSSAYDLVICTQVLEHLSDPRAAVGEKHRVLRDNGVVLFTTNFIYGLHGAPEDYFRFSRFGLKLIFEDVGFTIEHLTSRGGYFGSIAQFYFEAPQDFVNTVLRGTATPSIHDKLVLTWKRAVFAASLLTLLPAIKLICWANAAFFQFLDLFSGGEKYSVGYAVLARKV